MKPKRWEIEKVFLYDYKDYQIKIERNYGKDCFLSIQQVKNLPLYQRPEILIGKGVQTTFLTLKGAKAQGIKIIDDLVKLN